MSDFISNKPPANKKHTQANSSKEDREKVLSSGLAQGITNEPKTKWNKAACEVVYPGNTNCEIVLGRDRDGSWSTGEGRSPKAGTSSITLLCGRIENNPNFGADAASICISENSLIDRKYDLMASSGGEQQIQTRSSIGMKADDVRMVGRRSLKIITTGEPTHASMKIHAEQGLTPSPSSNTGIDIIANNETDSLQPIVLGDNLVDALSYLAELLEQLIQLQVSYYSTQNDLNMTLIDHMHFTGFYDNISLFSEPVTFQGVKTMCNQLQDYALGLEGYLRDNLANFSKDYLSAMGGNKYINSRYNKVN
jgi:hypothetical protein